MVAKETYEANLKALDRTPLRPRGRALLGIGSHLPVTPVQNALLRRAAIRIVRRTLYWSELERPDGTWNEAYLKRWDEEITSAQKMGLEPLVVVHGPPAGLDWDHRQDAYRRFASAMGRLASRWPQIRYWELWNEMDAAFTDLFGAGRADVSLVQSGRCYGEMLALAAPAIRKGSPKARIVLGGMATQDGKFLEGIYEAGGRPHFDVANVHTYGVPLLWAFVNVGVRARAVMAAHGDAAKPLWNTEFGNSGGATVQAWGIPKDQELGDYLDEKQRDLLAECVLANRKYGLYDVAMFYQLVAEPEGLDSEIAKRGGLFPQGRTVSDYTYGLLRADGVTPRPALAWLIAHPK